MQVTFLHCLSVYSVAILPFCLHVCLFASHPPSLPVCLVASLPFCQHICLAASHPFCLPVHLVASHPLSLPVSQVHLFPVSDSALSTASLLSGKLSQRSVFLASYHPLRLKRVVSSHALGSAPSSLVLSSLRH